MRDEDAADVCLDRPLFSGPESVVSCYVLGMGTGIGGVGLDPERRPTGNSHAFMERIEHKAERLARANAILMRAFPGGFGTHNKRWTVMVALIGYDLDWHQAAEMAGLDDGSVTAGAVRQRVYRAYHAGLRAVRGCMG